MQGGEAVTSVVWVVPFARADRWVTQAIAAATRSAATRAVVAVNDGLDTQGDSLPKWFPHLHYVVTPGEFGLQRAWIEGADAGLGHRHTHTVLLYPGCVPDPEAGWSEVLQDCPVVSKAWNRRHWIGLDVAHTRRLVDKWELPDVHRVGAVWSSLVSSSQDRSWIRMPLGPAPLPDEIELRRRAAVHRRPEPPDP